MSFHQSRFFYFITAVLVVTLASSGRGQDCTSALNAAHSLYELGQYQTALEAFQALAVSPSCDNEGRGEAHFYSALCYYHLGEESDALLELRQSITLRPKRRLTGGTYPARIYELWEQARNELLCTVEIQVSTPGHVGIVTDGHVVLSYVRTDVPAGTMIRLEKSKYAPFIQPHMLMPGRVNRFHLEMKTIVGTKFLTLKFAGVEPDRVEPGVVREDNRLPYLESGGHRIDFQRDYYFDSLLTHITIGDDTSLVDLGVVESKPHWRNLMHHLEKNPGVRKWFGRFKIVSGVGLLAAGGVSAYFHSKASEDYERYLDALPDETYRTYRDYEHHIALRNIFGAAALTLAASEVVWFLGNPKDETALIDEFRAQQERTRLAIDYGPDFVGLKLVHSF